MGLCHHGWVGGLISGCRSHRQTVFVMSLPVRFVSLGVHVHVYIHDVHAIPSDSSACPHANA